MTKTDEQITQLRSANLPASLLSMTAASLSSSRCSQYLDYVKSPVYQEDIASGIGVQLCGDALLRDKLFMLTAKGLALNNLSVWFCSTLYLSSTLEHHDDEQRKKLLRFPNLFIENFEVKYKDAGSPLTHLQRMNIEEFLRARSNANVITNYSSWGKWDELAWWSEDFLSSQSASIRTFKI